MRTMRRTLASLLAVVALATALALLMDAPGMAQEPPTVGLVEVLADPTVYNGQTIAVEGELVGDYGFRRDGFMWTQLNDDSYARDALVDGGPRTGSNVGVGLRMPTEMAEGLDPAGGYRLEGPFVRVIGVWRYHDEERTGESFIDAESVVTLEQGRRLAEGPDWYVFAAGTILVMVALALWAVRIQSSRDQS